MIKNSLLCALVLFGLAYCVPTTKESIQSIAVTDTLVISHDQPHKLGDSAISVENYIIVEGDNVWIREKPSTGKVIFKLNHGQKAKWLGRGPFEVIRGKPDYWIQLEFEGKAGWVFGSQTNLKSYPAEFIVNNGEQLWTEFGKMMKGACSDGACTVEESDELSFTISKGEEGDVERTEYMMESLNQNAFLITQKRGWGDAYYCRTTDHLYASTKSGLWNLSSQPISGEIEKKYSIDNGNEIWITQVVVDCGAWLESKIWQGYIINDGSNLIPFFSIKESVYNQSTGERPDVKDGEIYIEGVESEFYQNGVNNTGIKIIEHHYKYVSEGEDSEVEGSPVIYNYKWEPKTKKVISESEPNKLMQ